MVLASPGVLIKELDLTASVQTADQNIAIVAIDAKKGPTDTLVYISSEKELIDVFGTPNDYNYESWFAALTILQYGGNVGVIRPSGNGLNNANVQDGGDPARSDLLIPNKESFELGEDSDFLFASRTPGADSNGISVVVVDHGSDQRLTLSTVAGLTEGDYIQWDVGNNTYSGNIFKIIGNNTVEVVLTDSTKRVPVGATLTDGVDTLATVQSVVSNDPYGSLEYAPGRKWVSVVGQPGTSDHVARRGGRLDQMHVLVIDTVGNYSGNPGSILEVFPYLSKAVDAKSPEGASIYYKTYINQYSQHIYAGDDALDNLDNGETNLISLANSGGNSADPGDPSGNINDRRIFKLFGFAGTSDGGPLPRSSTYSWTLGGGSDYDYDGELDAIRQSCIDAYSIVEDSESFGDIDFLVPGVMSQMAIDRLIDIAESRRDCMVVASPDRESVINSNSNTVKTDNIIEFFQGIKSSSFAIFDSGYKYIYDKFNDKYRYIPCAADVAGLCISTSINAEPWFSPAGYNRGNLKDATKLAYSPRQTERDRLYVNRINPIVSFPGQGIVLFGDKTALASPSAFDRINVRRLFIELEKNIAVFSKYQLFQINDEITRSGFKAAVEPYLRGVQGRRGIYDFLVICDSTNNTPDVIDRNELAAEIYIQPARSINYITITFVATRTGVSFNELTT